MTSRKTIDVRSKAIWGALFSGVWLKLVSIAAGLVAIGLSVRALGATPYGLLTTLTGVVLLLGFLDFGVGSAVIGRTAAAHARKDRTQLDSVATNALFFLSCVGFIILVAGILAVLAIPRTTMPEGPGLDAATSRASLIVFVCCLALGVPASLGGRLALGTLRGTDNNIVQAVGSLLSLIGTILGWAFSLSLPFFVLSFLLGPLLATGFQTINTFLASRSQVRFRVSLVARPVVLSMLVQGLPFTGLVLAGAVSLQTDVLVVGSVVSLAGAAAYGLLSRAFNSLTTLLGSGLQQMWGSTAHALAVDDVAWVRRSFGRMFTFTVGVYALGALAMTVFGPELVRIWSGGVVQTPFALAIAFALWNTYAFAMSQFSTLLNAAGVVRAQAIVAILMAAVNLPLSIYLASVWGLSGPLWASLITHGLIVGGPTLWLSRRVLTQKASGDRELAVIKP